MGAQKKSEEEENEVGGKEEELEQVIDSFISNSHNSPDPIGNDFDVAPSLLSLFGFLLLHQLFWIDFLCCFFFAAAVREFASAKKKNKKQPGSVR